MRDIQTTNLLLVIIGVSLSASIAFAATLPLAPTSLTAGWSSTLNTSSYGPQSLEALAGNITGIVVTAVAQTKAWQGYYGNITATITLDDVNNFTFYNWTAAEPRGQVYATLNNSITWGSVGCYLLDSGNETLIENFYNISTDDVDGVNETYIVTTHPSFEVGSTTISGCPTAYINQNDAAQSTNFVNVLLWDTNHPNSGWIYTTLIENRSLGSSNDLVCYNGQTCDFQLLVNEDGHGTDTATTTYYFWVEII